MFEVSTLDNQTRGAAITFRPKWILFDPKKESGHLDTKFRKNRKLPKLGKMYIFIYLRKVLTPLKRICHRGLSTFVLQNFHKNRQLSNCPTSELPWRAAYQQYTYIVTCFVGDLLTFRTILPKIFPTFFPKSYIFL